MRDVEVNMEPLPGYRLIEKIGAGGYGEVWRAEAPGGLTKAIKLVFGQRHEKRATIELRALEHIRGVRHPFLLSLERIEVVDDRLMVVTELADSSVKDRFDQCRRDNLRGIPRDELISYLRDAADALDFMSSTHALQHLDIKPENLLLLAGRVKVADFGLVKDVRQSQASLVGGMTPLYAAPEVFRGTPSRHSDQYSLAIVYQEMLTGALPFAGESAAELTLHHLNDEPDLSALSPMDRYSVSRALSKDPQHRYNTCREFVDSLANAGGGNVGESAAPADALSTVSAEPASAEYAVRESKPTDFFDDEQPAEWSSGAAHVLVDMPVSECRLVELPPIDLTNQQERYMPTLVLGIGGTAGCVMSHFRRMVRDEVGAMENLPAMQFLLIDTDSRTLGEVARDGVEITADEFLCLPLRRPQHYRDHSQQLLHWLSRRWLYNIPRSLRTEGLRPLGRLALADNARQAGQRIRRSMVQAVDPTAIAKSASALGKEFRTDRLRVFVVASIAGGTGGGMSLDIGYAVRAILQKLGLKHSQIIGLMMHSTGRDARQSELARVNAFSWLAEYHHFEQPENPYPGDMSCGLPSHAPGISAFDHTYLLHLGSNMDSAEFDHAAHMVADYIRLNTLSPASSFFDASRAAAEEAGPEGKTIRPSLRSFGIHREALSATGNSDELAAAICQRVLRHWKGVDGIGTTANEDDELLLVKRLQLDAGGIAANCRAFVDLTLGSDAGPFVSQCLKSFMAKAEGSAQAVLGQIDEFFGRTGGQADAKTTLAGKLPSDIVAPLAEKLCAGFRRTMIRHLDAPSSRIAGVRRSLQWHQAHLQQVVGELQRIRRAANERLMQVREEVWGAGRSATSINVWATLLEEYFHTSLDHTTILATEHVARSLIAEATAVGDQITSLAREIDQIALAGGWSHGDADRSGTRDSSGTGASREDQDPQHDAMVANLAAQVDGRLQVECIDTNGGLFKTIMQGGRPRAQLTSKLRELAQVAVQRAIGQESAQHSDGIGQPSAIALATPALLEYGGRRRMLTIVPATNGMSGSQDGKMTNTIAAEKERGTTVCVEADTLSAPHVALDFVERRRDRVEFASRVHSRSDIAWLPLIGPEPAMVSTFWGDESSRQVHTEQAAMNKTLVL